MASRSAAAGSSSGETLGIGRDALDEAGEDAAGPDLDERGDAGRGHRARRRRPSRRRS